MRAVAERSVVGEPTAADGDVALLGVDVVGVEFQRAVRVVVDESRHTGVEGPPTEVARGEPHGFGTPTGTIF